MSADHDAKNLHYVKCHVFRHVQVYFQSQDVQLEHARLIHFCRYVLTITIKYK